MNSSATLRKKVLQSILKDRLVRPGDRVLVGVSGGADSVALLHILNQLRTEIGFQIHAGHINHHLRKGADTDERFVKKFCAGLGVPYTAKDIFLAKKIKQGGSIEEIAREERIKALTDLAHQTSSNVIALAHHRDDLAETVLLRILRGTGLQGLQAILPKRLINGTLVVRPLLNVDRDEIEIYLKKNKISFRTDPTNKQTRFFRNKIRHDLLPLLKKDYQNNIKDVLCSLAATAGEDYDYLRRSTLKIFPKLVQKRSPPGTIALDLKKILLQPNAVKRMALRFAIETVKGHTLALDLRHLNELDELMTKRPAGAIVDLPHHMRAVKTKTALLIE